MLIKDCEEYVLGIIKELGYDITSVKLCLSNRPELGDYQINEAFTIGKANHENPRDVASKIVSKFDNRFTNVNIAGPGFINISFSDELLLSYLNNGINDFNYFIPSHEKRKVIIDFGGANAAKALHVGHMRSANIGEAVRRLAKVMGDDITSDVHLGDLGRQAGMLISEYKLMHPESVFFDSNYTGDYPKIDLTAKDLGVMYPRANIAAQNNPKRMEEVREITALIDKGHVAYTNLWKQMVDISSEVIKKTYDKLNCHFDLWEGELDAFKEVDNVLKIMKPYLYESEGALVIDVEENTDTKPIPPLMVIKNDGGTIYGTRDLGTIFSRINRFHPDEIWYFTDERQSLYFEQVFRGSYKSGLVDEKTKLMHFGFGTINGMDGKPYKTRDGGVMELDALIGLIREEIAKKIKDEIVGVEREEIIDKLTISTLKFSDLLPFRKTDYCFDPVKFASLDGKTGPYIMYSLVRMKSLLRKVDDYSEIKVINNSDTRDILVKILETSHVLSKCYEEKTLNYICDYLYELLSLYNKFYNNNNIMNESNIDVKNSYIALTKLVYNIAHNLLEILGIDEVEKM